MKKLRREDYTVGWICPLEVEQIAALHMLDEQHDRLPQPTTDHNVYNLGSIYGHNVVIAGLPQAGNNPAAAVVTQLRTTFPNVKFGLLVGIGGGVPTRTDSGMIRLGDVVVSKPTGIHSGAVQYDHGKARDGKFERTGALAPPPAVLLNAAQNLAAHRAMGTDDEIVKNIRRIDITKRALHHFKYPGAAQDRLYRPKYLHLQHGLSCDECKCDASQRIPLPADDDRSPHIKVHRGTIASGEVVLKDALLRDRLAQDGGLICFEMEAAGALTDFPCMIIRGVSDYCDSHKNDVWHGYAAAAAASYARQLFFHIPIDEVQPFHLGSSAFSYPLNAFVPVQNFVQRPSLRSSIREQLTRESDSSAQPRIVAVWGLGGAGKTQLVLNYRQHYRNDYDATFWIQAKQTASVDRDFMEICRQLPRASSVAIQTPEDARREVLTWLAMTPGRWLMVFDGADQLDANDKDYVDISLYIPDSHYVHVIITSRISAVRNLSTFEGVQVGELEQQQAVTLFRQCAGLGHEVTEDKINFEIKEIIEELGCLALAVSIAGTYISQTPRFSSNLPGYLKEYRQRRHKLLKEQPDNLVDKYPHSVMTVWETSYVAVKDQQPRACRLLTLLAFLNYEDIFLDLFGLYETDSDSITVETPWISLINQHGLDYSDLEKCFAILERYSLIQRQANNASYTMHRLVHAWNFDRLLSDNSTVELFWSAAFKMLLNATSNCEEHPESKLRLVPHLKLNIDIRLRLTIASNAEGVQVVDNVEHIAQFIRDIGIWKVSVTLSQAVFQFRQNILGTEDPDTIRAMANLAVTLSFQGKIDEAAALKHEVLEKSHRILGPEHPSTIRAMANLAESL